MTREALIERLAEALRPDVTWTGVSGWKGPDSTQVEFTNLKADAAAQKYAERAMPVITEFVRDWLKTQDYLDESSREAVLCSWWDEMGQEAGS